MDRQVSSKNSEAKYAKSDRKWCISAKNTKFEQRQYNKALRRYGRLLCEKEAA